MAGIIKRNWVTFIEPFEETHIMTKFGFTLCNLDWDADARLTPLDCVLDYATCKKCKVELIKLKNTYK